MNKQWSKPKLFNLSADRTEEKFGATGEDYFWDGVASHLDPTHGKELTDGTGS